MFFENLSYKANFTEGFAIRRSVMNSRAVLIVWLFFCAVSGRAEEAWKTYTNARFGFRLLYPASLVASREPDNGAGREFHSKNEEFSIAVSARFLQKDLGETLESQFAGELETLGKTITYKRKTADWYVVSGVAKDGTEFYHKVFAQGANYAAFHITYPHALNKQYDPWVARIEKGFVPFLPGDFDRIGR